MVVGMQRLAWRHQGEVARHWAWPRWLPNSSTRSRRSPAASSALSSSASGTCRAQTRRPSPCGE
jgi:hypothetical protein